MTEKAYAVPLHEQLARVPRDARLVIDDPDGMGTKFIPVGRYCHEAAAELRAALTQPEPELFGWVNIDEARQHFATAGCGTIYKTSGEGRVPLYTAPQREWQGLTDDEIIDAANMAPFETMVSAEDYIYIIARAIEDKLKERTHDKRKYR